MNWIDGRFIDGYLVIPKGMTPRLAFWYEDRLLVDVDGWTPKGEYEQTDFDLYNLKEATKTKITSGVNGQRTEETWYVQFVQLGDVGEPTLRDVI